MYFFDLNTLIDFIKMNRHFHKHSYKYLVAYAISANISASISKMLPTDQVAELSIAHIVISVLLLALTAIITYFIVMHFYNANGGKDGDRLLDKLICLSWVIGWRTSLVIFPLLFCVFVASGWALKFFFLLFGFSIIGAVIYFIRTTGKSLQKIHEYELEQIKKKLIRQMKARTQLDDLLS